MLSSLTLYHGSAKIIQNPIFGAGNPRNDYGPGFYMTEHVDLAKEWACSEERDGFANRYEVDTSELTILYLTRGDYHILNWLAILLENRTFRIHSDLAGVARDYILSKYLPEYQSYDLICGYRADDSYFSFVNLFLNNGISLDQLQQAMMLGNLGEQYVLKSQKAFKNIRFAGYEPAERRVYYPQKMYRDRKAREDFRQQKIQIGTGSYIMDILRERWENDDERLQRVISG